MPSAKATPVLDPIEFFTGLTQGQGRVKVVFKSAVPLKVKSRGVPDGKGGLVIDQRVREGDKPARVRRWIIRPDGAGRFTGTLTDAAGPVTVSAGGNAARIAYTMKNGLGVEQWLVLADDRRTIRNRMTIRKWGLRVASVEERIAKARPPA
jgi:hypothetical protein